MYCARYAGRRRVRSDRARVGLEPPVRLLGRGRPHAGGLRLHGPAHTRAVRRAVRRVFAWAFQPKESELVLSLLAFYVRRGVATFKLGFNA